jgi:hypothetical protein
MTESATDRVDSGARPLIFISHRHADKPIADRIREFVNERSNGRVEVFQSSDAGARGPKIGEVLNDEIKENLARATMVILVYTTEDEDWQYVMWECGLATDLRGPAIRIIVFQCGPRLPRVFADRVGVNIRKSVEIQRFANEFLTSSEFFPSLGQAIAPYWHANDANVQQAAQDFDAALREVWPLDDDDEVEEWPPYPYLRLELSGEQVRQIREESQQRRLEATLEVLQAALVVDGDREAARIFGMPSIRADDRFERFVTAWTNAFPDAEPGWLTGLAVQVREAAQSSFPTLRWELMRGIDPLDGTWYAPVLNRVREIKRTQVMQFDVYFDKFTLDEEHKHVEVGVPPQLALSAQVPSH